MNYMRDRAEVTPSELYDLFVQERATRSVQRDLDRLVEAQFVVATSAGKARRYHMASQKL